ncbi:MAG TPA: protein-L-isoaspartate O-methyltransferase, partial [Methylocella sp.]|nr:protein-L-isoaspartate O-methyltransferase [Methylocella sp.]
MEHSKVQSASEEDRLQSERNRRTMVDRQIRTFDVTDRRLLERMLEVPREAFLPSNLAAFAYSDIALQADSGGGTRMLLPPLVLARLLQAAEIKPTDVVLDVGGAFGYSPALLGGLARRVVAVESAISFYGQMRFNLDAFGLSNVRAVLGPLPEGAPADAPFDVIIVEGAVQSNLDTLFGQLRHGGRLLAFSPMAGEAMGGPSMGGPSKAARYEKVEGRMGYRVLF